jgi:hypothetical protein
MFISPILPNKSKGKSFLQIKKLGNCLPRHQINNMDMDKVDNKDMDKVDNKGMGSHIRSHHSLG